MTNHAISFLCERSPVPFDDVVNGEPEAFQAFKHAERMLTKTG